MVTNLSKLHTLLEHKKGEPLTDLEKKLCFAAYSFGEEIGFMGALDAAKLEEKLEELEA